MKSYDSYVHQGFPSFIQSSYIRRYVFGNRLKSTLFCRSVDCRIHPNPCWILSNLFADETIPTLQASASYHGSSLEPLYSIKKMILDFFFGISGEKIAAYIIWAATMDICVALEINFSYVTREEKALSKRRTLYSFLLYFHTSRLYCFHLYRMSHSLKVSN